MTNYKGRRPCGSFRNALLLGALCLAFTGNAAEEKPWNIISIVTDDQARWAVGAYGNNEVRTPNMDRLAREGALFMNAFVNTPVCSPSRASFLAGQYPSRLGISDWISPKENREGVGLTSKSLIWPAVLQKHGYHTGLIGKWHLGNLPESHPTLLGFSSFYGFLGGGTTPRDPKLEVDGVTKTVDGFVPDILGDAAIRFIEGQTTQPFALLLHFREPHMPYKPMPDEDTAVFKDATVTVPEPKGADIEQLKTWTRDYYTAVHAADRNIGRVMDKLDSLGLTSRTIVLFTSDHGYMIGHHMIHSKGNGWWVAGGVHGPKRPNMFEESIRIPMILRMPGVVKPGTKIDEDITNLDIFPTMLSLAGVEVPAGAKLDGRNLADHIRGGAAPETRPVFGQYDLHNSGLAFMRMVRTDNWKYVRHFFANGMDELYDLDKDPGERNNLIGKGQSREKLRELQKQLAEWQQSIDDPILKGLSAPKLIEAVSEESSRE